LPGLQKVRENKTVGQQYVLGTRFSSSIIKAVKDEKITKIKKLTADVIVAVATAVYEVQWRNP
jgi:hypothetical protein